MKYEKIFVIRNGDSKMDNEKLIESIKNICKNNNITVTKLEEELGMSQGLIGRWAKSDPSLSKIVDIADYFHVFLDEVVGYHNVINDKFIEKLIKQTSDKTVKWNKYVDHNTTNQPKQYFDIFYGAQGFCSQEEADQYYDTHKEISYFVQINNIYMSLYGMYEYHNIINPSDIKLFIQPGEEAQLIEQDYSYEQLKVLWLKVLYTLGENAPDEIKAEEFKNSFINDFKKPEPPKQKSKIVIPRESIKRSPDTVHPRPQNTKTIVRPPKPLTPPKPINKLDEQQNDTPKSNE